MLKKIIIGFLIIVAIVAGFVIYELNEAGKDHTGVALNAPETMAPAPAVPVGGWTQELAKRSKAKSDYITNHQQAYDWFTRFPFSEVDGTPIIILKLLPLIAPTQWASGDAFLSSVGLFHDARVGNRPLPTGVGFSALAREELYSNIDYTSFTCGACHVGRVKDAAGEITYIDGGINSEFNIVLYFVKLEQTLKEIYGDEQDKTQKHALATKAFLDALDKAVTDSSNFFYNNHAVYGRTYDAEYESKQVAMFRKDAAKYIADFVDYTEGFVGAYSAYMDKTYNGFQKEMLGGFPGMADATGVSAAHGYESFQTSFAGRLLAKNVLPDSPGITDFMPVWEQATRTAEWDPSQQRLINGGGQYNGNIPIPIYRNLAASLTLALKDTDLRVAAFSAELLDGLPATPYPFTVDDTLATRGKTLYENNCEGCHQPNNGKVYKAMGTNLSRSNVINTLLMEGARIEYKGICSPTTVIEMYGKEVSPCAEFKGVKLDGMSHVIMRPLDDQRGYNATALKGVWATAPYLHNGSVPTLYHLLVPELRPAKFIKGRLEYDQKNVGYAWQEGAPGGYPFDTQAFKALDRSGHDKNITLDGVSYRLDWSDNRDDAKAIIEYMKTL